MSRALAKSDQIPLGAYYTPDDVARRCVAALGDLRGLRCWEPHAGGGAFVRALERHGAGVVKATDCDPVVCERNGWIPIEFLTSPAYDVAWVVGNPPYSDAEAHVRHALEDIRPRVGVAFLLRLAFLESEKRIPFWREHPASHVLVLQKRPSFTGGGTDSAAYGFFIWRTGHTGKTTLGFLP